MSSLLRDFVGPFIIVCGFDASFFIAFRALAYIRAEKKYVSNTPSKRSLSAHLVVVEQRTF